MCRCHDKSVYNKFESAYCTILKQKSLATRHKYAYLLQKKVLTELFTNFTRFYCSKCDYNLIQYQILHASLQDLICMEHSAYKNENVLKSIKWQCFGHLPRTLETFPDSFEVLAYKRMFSRRKFAGRNLSGLNVIWMKWSSSGVIVFLFTRSRAVSSQPGLSETINWSLSNCFMNIKMKSSFINIDASFRHANHSSVFVSGSSRTEYSHKIRPVSYLIHTRNMFEMYAN